MQMFVCLGLTCFSISSFVGNVSDCVKKCLLGFVSIEFEFCSGVIRELNHCHLETHEIKHQGEEQKQTAEAKYILFQNLCAHSLPWPGSDFQNFHALQCRENRMCKGNSLP